MSTFTLDTIYHDAILQYIESTGSQRLEEAEMQTITIDTETYETLVAITVDEQDNETHLCEDKAEALYEANVEASGALGIMLEEWDAFSGSGKSHNTTLGYGEDSDKWDTLVVQFYGEDGEMYHDEYKIEVV